MPIAVLAAFSTVPEKIFRNMLHIKFEPDSYVNMALIGGAGEFKEYCFAIVMMFYVTSVYLQLGSVASAEPALSEAISAEKAAVEEEQEELVGACR